MKSGGEIQRITEPVIKHNRYPSLQLIPPSTTN